MPRRRTASRALRDRARDNRAADSRPSLSKETAAEETAAEQTTRTETPKRSPSGSGPTLRRRLDGTRPSPRPRPGSRPAPRPRADDEEESEGRSQRVARALGRRSRRALGGPTSRTVAVLATLAVLAGAAGVATYVGADRAAETTATEKAALAAASSSAEVVLSYDYRSMDRTIAAARKHSTGDFLDEYDDTSKVLKAQAPKVKAIVRADVVAASVVRSERDRAVILLFVNQATQNTTISGGSRVDQNRVRMTMVRAGSHWLVSGVDAL
jgi:Mce-associated membrane protein